MSTLAHSAVVEIRALFGETRLDDMRNLLKQRLSPHAALEFRDMPKDSRHFVDRRRCFHCARPMPREGAAANNVVVCRGLTVPARAGDTERYQETSVLCGTLRVSWVASFNINIDDASTMRSHPALPPTLRTKRRSLKTRPPKRRRTLRRNRHVLKAHVAAHA